jgi:hypothetical protein
MCDVFVHRTNIVFYLDIARTQQSCFIYCLIRISYKHTLHWISFRFWNFIRRNINLRIFHCTNFVHEMSIINYFQLLWEVLQKIHLFCSTFVKSWEQKLWMCARERFLFRFRCPGIRSIVRSDQIPIWKIFFLCKENSRTLGWPGRSIRAF